MAVKSGYNLTSSDGTTPKFQLGETVEIAGATYKYFKASGAIAAYDSCTVQNDWDAEKGTTTTSGAKPTMFCIPQFAVADQEYFWAPVGPFRLREDGVTTFKVNAALNCAGSVKLYTTATGGVVDDTATDLIAGLFLTETITTAEAADCMAVQLMVSNCQD